MSISVLIKQATFKRHNYYLDKNQQAYTTNLIWNEI